MADAPRLDSYHNNADYATFVAMTGGSGQLTQLSSLTQSGGDDGKGNKNKKPFAGVPLTQSSQEEQTQNNAPPTLRARISSFRSSNGTTKSESSSDSSVAIVSLVRGPSQLFLFGGNDPLQHWRQDSCPINHSGIRSAARRGKHFDSAFVAQKAGRQWVDPKAQESNRPFS